jgi:hypothetical protein
MSKNISFKGVFSVLVMITAVVYFGCEKKTDQSEEPTDNADTEIITTDTTTGDATIEKEPVEDMKITIPDIRGTWTGTFDQRSAVLNITNQTDSSFSGKISISYRQAINQDVKGSLSPATMNMEMKDQLHSRFQGKYNGKLSKDADNYSGTFIMDLDGSKFSFNLNKK